MSDKVRYRILQQVTSVPRSEHYESRFRILLQFHAFALSLSGVQGRRKYNEIQCYL
jgi:hypothetical protein